MKPLLPGEGSQGRSLLPFPVLDPVVVLQAGQSVGDFVPPDQIDGEDGAARQDILHVVEGLAPVQGEGAAEVARGVEDGKAAAPRIQREQ